MSRFIVLINFGGDLASQIKALPDILSLSRRVAGELGVVVESYDVTFGRFDAVAIIEAPSEPTAAEFILKTFGSGQVRTETMSAFTEDQIRSISEGLLD